MTEFVRKQLERAHHIIAELPTTIQRQDRTMPKGSAIVGKSYSSRPAARLHAAEIRNRLLAHLNPINAALQAGFPMDDPRIVRAVEALEPVIDEAWRAVDLPTEPEILAPCGRCGGALSATKQTGTVFCRACGEVYDIEERRTRKHENVRELDHLEGTLTQIAAWASAAGYDLKASTMRSWVSRKKLSPVGENDDGHRLYSWADVQTLLDARKAA